MKRFLSALLTLAVATNSITTSVAALGYNKVIDNKFGGKTTYVSSEHLDEYMAKLRIEMEKVKQKYEDKYEIHPWKGFFMELAPTALATVLNISIGLAMKIFNYTILKKSLKTNQPHITSSDGNSEPMSRTVSPIPRDDAMAKGFWENSALSVVQILLLSVVSGFTYFLSLVKANNYTRMTQSFHATNIWEKNERILDKLTDAINDPDQTVRFYGAEIICEPSTFLDKVYKDCRVNSQEYFFDPSDEDYDLNLVQEMPELND